MKNLAEKSLVRFGPKSCLKRKIKLGSIRMNTGWFLKIIIKVRETIILLLDSMIQY